jgi:hypothetical protein
VRKDTIDVTMYATPTAATTSVYACISSAPPKLTASCKKRAIVAVDAESSAVVSYLT